MITFVYWILLLLVVAGVIYIVGGRLGKWPVGLIAGLVLFLVGTLFYYFYLEQAFVKRFGGVMSIKVPEGQQHIAATWKDDNLWVENYDPATNTCVFQEYSRGHLLEGKVLIRDCNPLRH